MTEWSIDALTAGAVALRVEVTAGPPLRSTRFMADVHHETVFFSGRVQGVGFRYTTMEVARGFEVTGSVMNLADGRVQLEAEGRAEEVAAFIAAVADRMHGHIRKTERTGAVRPAQFRDFAIK